MHPTTLTSETVDVRRLFQVNVAVPFATTVVVAVIWSISSVQFDGLANRSVAFTVALVTDPRQPLSLAPLIDTVDRTKVVSPIFGRPGASAAVPCNDVHVVPPAAPADEASITPTGNSNTTATNTRSDLRTQTPQYASPAPPECVATEP